MPASVSVTGACIHYALSSCGDRRIVARRQHCSIQVNGCQAVNTHKLPVKCSNFAGKGVVPFWESAIFCSSFIHLANKYRHLRDRNSCVLWLAAVFNPGQSKERKGGAHVRLRPCHRRRYAAVRRPRVPDHARVRGLHRPHAQESSWRRSPSNTTTKICARKEPLCCMHPNHRAGRSGSSTASMTTGGSSTTTDKTRLR